MAIIAISVGMVMMLIAIATGLGLQQKIREKVVAFQGHIQISNYDNNASEVSISPISKEQNFYPHFIKIPQVAHIQAVIKKGGIIRTEKTYEAILAKGVGADYDWQQMQHFLVEGEIPNFKSEEMSDKVLISKYLANRLELKLGDFCQTIFLKNEASKVPNQRKFKIAGIYESGFQEFDASYIFLDIKQLQNINKWKENEIGNFEVFIRDFNKIDEIGDEIYLNTSSTLDSQTITQKFPSIFEWLKMFDFNIYLIILIMIVVGGFNMITAILVLILERTPMIGTLKSLGMPNKKIRVIFLYNAGYLILQGLFWGNLIGFLLLFLQYHFKIIKLNAETYYVNEVPIFMEWWHIIALNFGVLVLCLLILLIPTFIISKISPTKSMRLK